MIRKTSSLYKKTRGFVLVGCAAAIAYMLYGVHPYSLITVSIFVFAVSLFLATCASLFLRLRDSFIVGVTVLVLLFLSNFLGFNVTNTVLLISFVLGLRFLIQ